MNSFNLPEDEFMGIISRIEKDATWIHNRIQNLIAEGFCYERAFDIAADEFLKSKAKR